MNSAGKELLELRSKSLTCADLALPNNEYTPPEFPQLAEVQAVPLTIALEFWEPVFDSGLRNVRLFAALVLMPEATPDFNDAAQTSENKIRLPRKLRRMKPVAVSHRVNEPPHDHLGRGVFRPNAAHVGRAPVGGELVRHTARPRVTSEISRGRLPLIMIFSNSSGSEGLSSRTAP
jgi:hypothetical protein